MSAKRKNFNFFVILVWWPKLKNSWSTSSFSITCPWPVLNITYKHIGTNCLTSLAAVESEPSLRIVLGTLYFFRILDHTQWCSRFTLRLNAGWSLIRHELYPLYYLILLERFFFKNKQIAMLKAFNSLSHFS